jgi:hypothetical protein
MDQPGDQVLSGTGFALEQDRGQSPARRRSLDDLADLLAKSTYHGRSANQVAEAIHAAIMGPTGDGWPLAIFRQ